MQAVILAAGIGKRMRPLTRFQPKLLLPIHGEPILKLQLTTLTNYVNHIVLIIGTQGGCWNEISYRRIENLIKEFNKDDTKIEITYNDKNLTTDSSYSFKCALNLLNPDDTLCVDGDVIFKKLLVDKLISNVYHTTLVIRPATSKYEKGGKVIIDERKKIVISVGRHISIKNNRPYIYSGICKIDKENYCRLKKILENKRYYKTNLVVPLRIIAKKYKNIQYIINEDWMNINTLSAYIKAHKRRGF